MAFIPLSTVNRVVSTHGSRMMVDPSVVDTQVSHFITQHSSDQIGEMVSTLKSSSVHLAFSDQGQNLAGIFFQASLLPYLAFLYFLSFRANRINNIGNFGFQFILLFVVSTIPAGIISKLTYGTSLANVDWLHGGAELLLTIANILIVRPPKISFVAAIQRFQLTCRFNCRFLVSKRLQPTQTRRKLT
jgi:hypothetical protein